MKSMRFRVEEIKRRGTPSLKVSLAVRLGAYHSATLVQSCHTNRVFVIRNPHTDRAELFSTVRKREDPQIKKAKKQILSVVRDIGAQISIN
jgi:hypothetical protein